jgi:hypothetical protein
LTKDAYYFSHDANAHKDPKVLKLRMKFGWEGYGIYWAIIETLREQPEYKWKANDKALLSYTFANGEPIVTDIVDHCIEIGLLENDGTHIYSQSLLKRMEKYENKRKKRVEAGKKGAQKRWGDNDSKDNHKQSDSNAISTPIAKNGKGKESKVKESKDIYTPEFEEFWKVYPRKIEKKQAATKFRAKIKQHNLSTIVEGTKAYVQFLEENQTDKKYIKHAATFLNNDSFLEYSGSSEEPKEIDPQEKIRERKRELEMSIELGEEYWRKFETIEEYESMKKELEELEQL